MHKLKIVIILLLTIFLSGCWDKIEINNRAFITAIGIDKYIEEELGHKILATYEYPNLKSIGKDASGPPKFVLSSIGRTMPQITNQITTRTNRALTLAHTKAIIIGEDLAKDRELFMEVLDGMERDTNIGRKINVLITSGKAQEIINIKPKTEPIVGSYTSQLLEGQISARFNSQTSGELLTTLHSNKNALMPRIIPAKEELKIAGSAVVKNYMLIGYLGELETKAIMILKNKFEHDEITIVLEPEGIGTSYVMSYAKTEKEAKVDDRIKFIYNIKVEGYLDNYKQEEGNLLDSKFIEKLEKKFEKKLEDEIIVTLEKLQKDFSVDIIGVDDYLSKYKPKFWNDIKDDWDKEFKGVEFSVNVDAKIRRIGMTR
ncbi:MAG: Ger(x)C family spore germination protein [Firmicutes bacterium]|nr:Ger(x)C family spore germination protein [Bacillota bacterium]